MRSLSLLLMPLGLALALGSLGCVDGAAEPDATLLDDATALAALTDGDGEDLSAALATLDLDDAVEEDLDVTLMEEDDMARECRFVDFRRKVVAEYDVDGDGGLDVDERRALRDDFAPRPLRRRLHALFHGLVRLEWIYDADDSRHLDGEERDALRADLELRCMNREAWLLETYDEDGNGELSDEEWSAAVEDLAARKQARRDAFLETYDTNEDGRLDAFERIPARIDRLERIAERQARALEEYDVDEDGVLSTEERAPLRERLMERVRGDHLVDGDDDDGCEMEPCDDEETDA
jgi:hypothetical protein